MTCLDCGHVSPRHLLGCPSDTHELTTEDYEEIAKRESLRTKDDDEADQDD
jgi:hypothetical protein